MGLSGILNLCLSFFDMHSNILKIASWFGCKNMRSRAS